MSKTDRILRLVAAERERQELLCQQGKFGATAASPKLDDHAKFAILGEEFGEVAKNLNEASEARPDWENLRTELIQIAAVAVAWVESLEP